MFFESRRDPPRLGGPWAPVAEAFDAGRVRRAYELGGALAPDGPDEVLLWGDVVRAAGDEGEFHRLVATARRRFPDDVRLRLQHARVLAIRGRLLASERLTRESTDAPDPALRTLACAQLAAVLGQMQRERPALEAVAAAAELPLDPMAMYELGYALYSLRRWEEALAWYRRVADACPRWPRPPVFIALCLNSLGRIDEADAILERTVELHPEEWGVAVHCVGTHLARERWAEAAALLSRRIDAWGADTPQAAVLKFQLVRARWRLGDTDGALAAARELSPEGADRLAARGPGARRRRLPIRPLVQHRMMCVPTSVAMLLRARGEPADPARMFEEMRGRDGVASPDLDAWCRRRRLAPVDVAVEPEAVRRCIDLGQALLASRPGLMSSHMELVVGYDDAFEEIEAVDPMDGMPVHVPYEHLADVYGGLNGGLVALASGPLDVTDAPAAAMRDARRAMRDGDVEALHRAVDASADPRRDLILLEAGPMLATPAEQHEAARRLVRHPGVDRTAKLNILVGLADEPVPDDLRALIHPPLRIFLELHRARGEGRWDDMLARVTHMLERDATMADLWFQRAIAMQGLCDLREAKAALEICLQIEPHHLGARLAQLNMPGRRRRPEDARALLATHPHSESVVAQAAQLEFESGDPAAGERLLRDALRRWPHSVQARSVLDGWLVMQDRPDLISAPAEPAEPTDTAGWIQSAWAELARRERGPARERLRAMFASGRLTANEELEHRQIEILAALSDPEAPDDPARVEALLPDVLLDPVEEVLSWFLSRVQVPDTRRRTAAAMLKWVEGVAGEAALPSLRFEIGYLRQQAGDTAAAIRDFTPLAKEGVEGAAFQLGFIAATQGRTADAIGHLEEAVRVSPGQRGSLELLARLTTDADRLIEIRRRIVDRVPYEETAAGALLTAIADASVAEAWLEENRRRYTPAFATWWKLELLQRLGKHDQVLAGITPAFREAQPREAWMFELSALEQSARLEAARVDAALRECPDDAYFLHLKATLSPRPEAREIYAKLFPSMPQPAVAVQLVALAEPRGRASFLADVLARDGWTADARRRAIEALDGVLLEPRLADDRLALFQKLRDRHPDEPAVLRALAWAYYGRANRYEASRVVDALLERDGTDPEHIRMAAVILQEQAPERALQFADELHRRTRDPNALIQSARCSVILGRQQEGLAKYRLALERLPGNTMAVSNLYLLGEPPREIYRDAVTALERGEGGDMQYFCVVAVQAALAAGRPLPAAWEAAAAARLAAIEEVGDAFGNEREELRSMLWAWCVRRGSREALGRTIPGALDRFLLRVNGFMKPWRRRSDWVAAE